MFFGGVRVYLGFVWGRCQTFRVLKGLLSFRIGFGCIDIVHIGVYLGLRSRTVEKRRSKKAEKKASEEKQEIKKQRSRTVEKKKKHKSRSS